MATNNRLSNIIVNHATILNIIRDLNPSKAQGYDGIRMIKMCEKSIIPPLMIIFNKAILDDVYLNVWKKGNIVTIHRTESKNLVKFIGQLAFCQSMENL